MSFTQALSGLNAQQEKLGVVGNNIANSQTVGFKSSNVQFADVFANSRVGLGTRTSAVLQNFSQGNIESTNRNMDLAIAGEGFFRFQQSSGEVGYSRNGQLTMTSNGDLVNAQGARIMGYGLSDANDAFSAVVRGGAPVPIRVPADDMPAQATGTGNGENPGVQATYNLDASIDVANASLKNEVQLYDDLAEQQAGDQPSATAEYHYSNSFSVYDSLGTSHNVTVYFEKTGDNTWNATTAINGVVGASNFGLSFNNNGTLTRDGNGDITGVGGSDRANLTFTEDLFGTGAADLQFDFTLAGTTQFSNDSTNSSLTQDGYTSGSMVGITIEDDGTVMRNYSNEQSVAAGQIALVSFRNPEGLQPNGDNLWAATGASGQELLGAPGTGLRGLIESSAIETSNVDMARELVDMIVAQRAYQANSQTISTQDELLQTIINI
ncbi:flagellar hook protein FlgE [Vreelandella maris]|jgi:flagellar hook protein FlgE|uniref:flagellar hook protein FlgE n=1 Tax=Vreelandella maris TaxID=2729617 RepID=UPI0030ECCFE5|tara:strand:- start:173 stop:1483 length:1311 start_codon:yes stop_codon:yes gene_type:complete